MSSSLEEGGAPPLTPEVASRFPASTHPCVKVATTGPDYGAIRSLCRPSLEEGGSPHSHRKLRHGSLLSFCLVDYHWRSQCGHAEDSIVIPGPSLQPAIVSSRSLFWMYRLRAVLPMLCSGYRCSSLITPVALLGVQLLIRWASVAK